VIAQVDPLGDSDLERVLFELTRIAIRPAASERVRAVERVCTARPQALILALDA
jgi:hypothetical protein